MIIGVSRHIGALVIVFILFTSFFGCKKENTYEGPKLQANTKSTAYREYILTDFEDGGVLNTKLEAGKETWAVTSIKKDTSVQNINYYFSLVNSVNVTWDWYLGGLRMKAAKYGHTTFDSIFNMDSKNIANTYFNLNLYGNPNIEPKSFALIQLNSKSSGLVYQYQINLTWTGWKFISIPLDAFATSTNATMTDFSDIKEIDIILLFEKGKNTLLKPISMNLDNLVITQNGVYQ